MIGYKQAFTCPRWSRILADQLPETASIHSHAQVLHLHVNVRTAVIMRARSDIVAITPTIRQHKRESCVAKLGTNSLIRIAFGARPSGKGKDCTNNSGTRSMHRQFSCPVCKYA